MVIAAFPGPRYLAAHLSFWQSKSRSESWEWPCLPRPRPPQQGRRRVADAVAESPSRGVSPGSWHPIAGLSVAPFELKPSRRPMSRDLSSILQGSPRVISFSTAKHYNDKSIFHGGLPCFDT